MSDARDKEILRELTKRMEQFGFTYTEETQPNGSGVDVTVCLAEPIQRTARDGSARQAFAHGYTYGDARTRMIARYAMFKACSGAYKLFG